MQSCNTNDARQGNSCNHLSSSDSTGGEVEALQQAGLGFRILARLVKVEMLASAGTVETAARICRRYSNRND